MNLKMKIRVSKACKLREESKTSINLYWRVVVTMLSINLKVKMSKKITISQTTILKVTTKRRKPVMIIGRSASNFNP